MVATTQSDDSERREFAIACGHARRVAVLASVEALLDWDEQTTMPGQGG
jgi:Zn-dependent M32 family carboxypeptidase